MSGCCLVLGHKHSWEKKTIWWFHEGCPWLFSLTLLWCNLRRWILTQQRMRAGSPGSWREGKRIDYSIGIDVFLPTRPTPPRIDLIQHFAVWHGGRIKANCFLDDWNICSARGQVWREDEMHLYALPAPADTVGKAAKAENWYLKWSLLSLGSLMSLELVGVLMLFY